VDVIVENIEGVPSPPVLVLGVAVPPVPPPPTVIG
jgi:hypothetical protein